MMFGGGGGGHWGGRPGAQSGLPFAGIPPEMLEGVQKLIANEPEHPEPDIDFSHVEPDRRPFTLRRLVRPVAPAMLFGVFLVALETITMQAGPLLTQRAIDKGMTLGRFDVVVLMAGLYLGAIVINGVITGFRVSWTGRLGQKLMYGLRIRVFSHIQRMSLDYFTAEKAGRIMTRMTSDVEALTELLGDGIINLVVQAFTLIFVVTVLFTLNATLAAWVLLAILPVMVVLTLWFRSASERGYDAVREKIADLLADLQENLSGIRILTAYNRQWFNAVKHRNAVGDHQVANQYSAKVASIYGPASDAVGTLGQGFILLVGGRMVLRGELSLGELAAFVLYLSAFFAPIQQLVQLYNQYQSGQAAVTKLRELLASDPSVRESAEAVDLPAISGEITFDNVEFSYLPGQPVLRDINLTIAAGETFSLVGQTGGGKSTIAKLVTRFYDPEHGRVLLDGHDLRDVTFASLRRQLGVVPQEPFLFGGSIRDNITFARTGASDDQIMAAVEAVGLADLVARLPQGLDTPVFERGSSLSSGERQLLALARAFLAEPRVLILDEATSSLDLKSESTIERALDNVLEGRTAIIIAHRLSTAMRADRIAVVNDGRIVELGSHAELMTTGGIYAGMYAQWLEHMADDHATDPAHERATDPVAGG
ncbi:MAG: ABC transporter ATP-binding protein [Acidimicrobiales bacterium]